MRLCTSRNLHRVTLAAVLAGVATFTGSAVGDPAAACAAPREWDIGAYDSCVATVYEGLPDNISPEQNEEMWDSLRWCCESTGGRWKAGSSNCEAPPAEQAQEAERAPVGTPFIGPDATLWMPPPVGPVAPPPTAVMQD